MNSLLAVVCFVQSVCLKKDLQDRHVAYSYEVVCTPRLIRLFVCEYPRISQLKIKNAFDD